jgi:hypothetical protein
MHEGFGELGNGTPEKNRLITEPTGGEKRFPTLPLNAAEINEKNGADCHEIPFS